MTEVVSTESTDHSYLPSVAVDPDGDIHITWDDYTDYDGSGSDEDIFYKRVDAMNKGATIFAYSPWRGAAYKTFNLDNDVYCRGENYQPNDKVDVYMVRNVVVWETGIDLKSLSVVRLLKDVQIDSVGNLQSTLVWPAPLTAGVYDLVVDIDQDGYFTARVDALEDNGVIASLAGMFAIPELLFGTLQALADFITGLVLLRSKRIHLSKRVLMHISTRFF